VELSSKIREILRQAKESHKKMQTQLSQEEKDLAKGKVRSSFPFPELVHARHF
jgi:hypothetical protein